MDPPIVNSRFNLHYYLPTEQPSSSDSFHKLLSSYTTQLQNTLSDHEWQRILCNKSVTQTFLDKAARLFPKGHDVLSEARKFDWNSSTFSSMEMIRYLKSLQNDPNLSEMARGAIAKWLDQES